MTQTLSGTHTLGLVIHKVSGILQFCDSWKLDVHRFVLILLLHYYVIKR
jgi:hypothetical protein